MKYPKTLSQVLAATDAYRPPEKFLKPYAAALTEDAPPRRIVAIFRMLNPIEKELDDEGRAVLCGCARLIGQSRWSGLADEAFETLETAPAKLPKPPKTESAGEKADEEPIKV